MNNDPRATDEVMKEILAAGITAADIIDIASSGTIFPHVCPRRVPRQSGFPDPRLMAANLVSNIEGVDHDLVALEKSQSAPTMLAYAAIADRYQFPLFHASRELVKAISLSSIDESFNLCDCNWPFPAFSVLMPQEYAIQSSDGPISSIGIYRADGDGIIEMPPWTPFRQRIRSQGNYGIIGACDEPPFIAYTLSWDGVVGKIPAGGIHDV